MLEWFTWIFENLLNKDVLTIVAIVLGPIVSVRISQNIENKRHKKNRKLQIYKDLMATRRLMLHPDHVRALNLIIVEFSSDDDEDVQVRKAWHDYVKHLDDQEGRKAEPEKWIKNSHERLYTLLEYMAVALDFSVGRLEIEELGYSPEFYANSENKKQLYQDGMIDLLYGFKAIKVYNTPDNPDPRVRTPVEEIPKSAKKKESVTQKPSGGGKTLGDHLREQLEKAATLSESNPAPDK